jgi:UDP-N-acetylmuramoylalanine--D-glutamate ligase
MVVGLGRSGVAAGLALAALGETVIGVDGGSPDIEALAGEPRVETHLATDGIDLLPGVKTVIKSPGVPGAAPVVRTARALGMCVIGELELAWRLLPNDFIAVTGTNGKTTTVELIGRIHREAELEVAVAGNVGVALSSLLGPARVGTDPEFEGRGLVVRGGLDPTAVVVCEASSFQLEDTLAFAPEAAVLLNVSDDHLDRHGTMERYRAAKLEVFARQAGGDVAVAPVDLEIPGGMARRIRFGSDADAELGVRDGSLWWGRAELLPADEVRLRGPHNLLNAMAAAAVTLARGVSIDAVRAGLRGFGGVPHRLEEIATVDGVLYVNDSKATNVAGTLVALESFASGTIHLILGGRGKGQSFGQLRQSVTARCAGVYLIGEDASAIGDALGGGVPFRRCETLERAVGEARRRAKPGQVVLLSPACASWDQFADFEERGARFRELVVPTADEAQRSDR